MIDRILIVGSKRKGALENAYACALDRLGKQVDHFDVYQHCASLMRTRIVNRLTQRLQSEIVGSSLFSFLKTGKEQYEAIIVFKGMLLSPSWIDRCKALSAPAIWVNVNPDDPFNTMSRGSTNENVSSSIGHYEIYATWGKGLIPSIQQHGCADVFFLPFAHDADNHYPADGLPHGNGEYIAFVGAWDREREAILSELADFPIKIYGYGWDRVNARSPLRNKVQAHNIYGAELREIISSAKAAINILRPQNLGSHNMRTFEIPAMRGLMLTTYSEEQDGFFPDGRASLMFSDSKELRQKLKRVLDGEYDVAQMKETAFRLSRDHSYDNRARTLCDRIALYQQSKTAQ